jgi:hypothetical protein
MTTNAPGALSRLCIEPGSAPHTFDASSEPYELIWEDLKKYGAIAQNHGNRGTRSRSKERVREGAYLCHGPLVISVTPGDLDLWLPRMLGTAEVADVFSLADTLPSFGYLINRVTQTFQYKDCKIDKWVLQGVAGDGSGEPDLLKLILYIMAKDEVVGTSMPSLTLPITGGYAPYMFSDFSTVSIHGAARRIKSFALIGDNFLSPRMVNSLTADTLCPTDRAIILRATFPFDDDHDDLHDIGTDGVAATIALTNGNLSTTFAMPCLDAPADSPTVNKGKAEIDITCDFVALKSGSTPEIQVTNASVP